MTKGSAFAAGLTMFVAVLIFVSGLWNILNGLAALLHGDFFVKLPNYLFRLNVTGWGWIHLIFGIALVIVGWALMSGAPSWARVVALLLVGANSVLQFLWLPYYPLWAIIIIALDILILWGLVRDWDAAGYDVTRR